MGLIDNVDFFELDSEKYWSFGKAYKGNPRDDAKMMVFSGDYMGARKMDGAYFRFIKDMEGNISLQGRSRSVKGIYLNKYDWVPQLHPYFESLPNGTCLLGELYFPDNEGSSNVTTIIGCLAEKAIARQEKGAKLNYYIFDVWAWAGKSFMNMKAEDRFAFINTQLKSAEYIQVAKYLEDQELWDSLGQILSSGGEGIVITKKDSIAGPGKRTARKTLKIKKEISENIDCMFTGKFSAPTRLYSGKGIEKWQYWEDTVNGKKIQDFLYKDYMKGRTIEPVTKPYFFGWASSFEIGVTKDGKVIPIGFLSNLTDDIKAHPVEQKGKIIEVNCMEVLLDKQGDYSGLRHAKLIRFRPDLNYEDISWDKAFGNN